MANVLVIEDEDGIMPSIEDAVVTAKRDSLHRAKSLEEARELYGKRSFRYALVDLKIPASKNGAFPVKTYGLTAIQEIRESKLNADAPVIAMTSHHSDGFDLSIQLHDLGVNDCISKPFDENRPLLKVIEDVLLATGAETAKAAKVGKAAARRRGRGRTKERPFPGGKMVFYADRVELCDVKILGDTGLQHSRKMLDILRAKKQGKFIRIGLKQLTEKVGKDLGGAVITEDTIRGCVSTLRKNVKQRLARDCGFVCGQHDVLVRNEQGYHLNDDKITVEDGKDEE